MPPTRFLSAFSSVKRHRIARRACRTLDLQRRPDKQELIGLIGVGACKARRRLIKNPPDISLALADAAAWKLALAAFLCFRLFDILKPFPPGRAERLRGGWGIVVDDLVAGIYAAIAVHLWFHYV